MKLNILVFLILFISICNAQQGNYKFNNFGNTSMLLSGNVTGSVNDLGVVYYNPARLTEVKNTTIAYNARAFQLTSIKFENFLGDDSKVKSSNFNGRPALVGGTFQLFNNRFAYSYINKAKIDNVLRNRTDVVTDAILDIYPDAEKYGFNVLLRTELKDDWFGLTWAKKVNEKFSLGATLFGSIYKYKGGSELSHVIQSSDNSVTLYENITGFEQQSYGLLVKIGANYHFPKFDLGLNVNLPYLEVYNKGKFEFAKVIAGVNEPSDQFYNYLFKGLSSQRKEPLGISLGVGVPFQEDKLHVNIDYTKGLSEYDRIKIPNIETSPGVITPVLFEESRKNVFNFGAGYEWYVNEKITSFFGISTDFNAFIKNANIFDLSSDGTRDVNIGEDFMHYSAGIDLKLPWISLFLGTTFTNGSTKFMTPNNLTLSVIDYSDYTTTNIKYNRWQFVTGIEVPFLNDFIEAKRSKLIK